MTGTDIVGTGRDSDGVVVTLTAPASPRFLDGTWAAASGKTGTFAVAKEQAHVRRVQRRAPRTALG